MHALSIHCITNVEGKVTEYLTYLKALDTSIPFSVPSEAQRRTFILSALATTYSQLKYGTLPWPTSSIPSDYLYLAALK